MITIGSGNEFTMEVSTDRCSANSSARDLCASDSRRRDRIGPASLTAVASESIPGDRGPVSRTTTPNGDDEAEASVSLHAPPVPVGLIAQGEISRRPMLSLSRNRGAELARGCGNGTAHRPLVRDTPERGGPWSVSYTHLRAHETGRNLVCRLL